MEDAVAASEGSAEASIVQYVGAAQGKPLLGSIQGKQVGVLAVSFFLDKGCPGLCIN